jgi:hypothetical protein
VSDHAPTGPARPAADSGTRDGAGYEGAGTDGAGRDGAGHHDTGHHDTGHDGTGYEAIGHDGGLAIPAGFGLAVISGLAEDVRVLSTSSGVSVRMSWPSTATAS